MSIKAKEIKRSISEYLHLHWNINIFHQEITGQYYIGLKNDLKELKNQEKDSAVNFPVTKLYPCYQDKKDVAGKGRGDFYQDLHVAQRIFANNPIRHIDIGSRIDGFVAHVASFRKIEIFDIRPMNDIIPNVTFIQSDLMEENEALANSCDSISSLSVLEHFGLGRYGDSINFEGYLIGFKNITKILQQGGKFYFSVPLGEQRIEFHAHRVFSLKYLLEMITPYYHIDDFSYVDDNGDFYPNVEITTDLLNNNCNCHFGNAIFELTKK